MNKFLTSKEAADNLGISEDELQGLVDKGKIPVYKIGGVYARFKGDDLNLYRRRAMHKLGHGQVIVAADRIKDFFYFNDFYIYSFFAIIVILYFIFK